MVRLGVLGCPTKTARALHALRRGSPSSQAHNPASARGEERGEAGPSGLGGTLPGEGGGVGASSKPGPAWPPGLSAARGERPARREGGCLRERLLSPAPPETFRTAVSGRGAGRGAGRRREEGRSGLRAARCITPACCARAAVELSPSAVTSEPTATALCPPPPPPRARHRLQPGPPPAAQRCLPRVSTLPYVAHRPPPGADPPGRGWVHCSPLGAG